MSKIAKKILIGLTGFAVMAVGATFFHYALDSNDTAIVMSFVWGVGVGVLTGQAIILQSYL